jgi:hypothetical protein
MFFTSVYVSGTCLIMGVNPFKLDFDKLLDDEHMEKRL